METTTYQSMHYISQQVRFREKCVELRMRIATHPQGLHDWDEAEYDL